MNKTSIIIPIKNHFIIGILVFCLLMLQAVSIQAAAASESGRCGSDVYWTYEDGSKTLIIHGAGAMYDYSEDYSATPALNTPWEESDFRYEAENIIVQDGVTTIGNHAFEGFFNVKEIQIPDGITSIGDNAFFCCFALEQIRIPGSVKRIGNSAFSGCDSLVEIQVPGGVTTIGDQTFSQCDNLTRLTIPGSVTNIGHSLIYSSENLHDIYYAGTEKQWDSIDINYYNEDLQNATIHFQESYSGGFVDVYPTDYYAEPVDWAVENAITNGTSPTTFSPDSGCTRGQVVMFLWRLSGSPYVQSTGQQFSDVFSNQYYAEAVNWAVAAGITEGVGNGRFSPDSTCTRAQIVTFLWRYKGHPPVSISSSSFLDVPIGQYYVFPVTWAVQNGITNGVGNGRFDPNATCTRGQVVTFLYRVKDMA